MSKFYFRKIYSEISEHLKKKQITVLTGMRRTGKTTIVKQLLSELETDNKLFFDLQKLSNQDLFSDRNFDNIALEFKQQGIRLDEKAYIGIDEVQLLPQISGVIKYLYDHYDIKFVITGSSSYYLKNLFNESLAGRKKIFELFPLSFGEFLAFKGIKSSSSSTDISGIGTFNLHEYDRLQAFYDEFVEFGGFPEVTLADAALDKRSLLDDIISSYVNIDIKALVDFRESASIYNLIKILAVRAGTRLDYSKLASLTGLSRITVMNYLDLFEKTYLIARVPVYTSSPDREIVKAQKFYFIDQGFLSVLGDVSGGARFENAVFAQLRGRGDLRYYALRSGQEIDFILDDKLALEAKETPTESDLNSLAALSADAGLSACRLVGRKRSPVFSDYIWAGDIR